MISGVPGLIGTSFNGAPLNIGEANPFQHFLMRNVSILSGACMMIRKEVFTELGGFDAQNTPTGHSDVDISFKIMEYGLRCVYTPHAIMTHIGNHSWELKDRQEKADIFCIKKWSKFLANDPYFTSSMREAYYYDQPTKYQFYCPELLINSNNLNARDVLFVSHELSLTGAPILLMDAIKVIIENGDFPVVMCPVDGPLRYKLLELGVVVIIDANLLYGTETFKRFAVILIWS
jgi:hypothetical protein